MNPLINRAASALRSAQRMTPLRRGQQQQLWPPCVAMQLHRPCSSDHFQIPHSTMVTNHPCHRHITSSTSTHNHTTTTDPPASSSVSSSASAQPLSQSSQPLHLTTRHTIPGRRITKDLGLVAASAFRSRNLLVDVVVAITRVFGGETPDYTHLLNQCTEKASQRLEETARSLGATSVVGVRFAVTTTMNRMIVGLHCSVLASGTAVIDQPDPDSDTTNSDERRADQQSEGGSMTLQQRRATGNDTSR